MPESTTAVTITTSAARRTIAVIDGNSLMHRAYHAIMQPMTAPDGRSTNALFGFFNMFIKMVETFRPDGVICAFDKGKPKVRMEKLPQYKAQRPPMDEALHEQFPMVKDLLRVLDVPVCELEGWEGDDILGTLARRGEAAGYEMLLFTGDRDMYQLATEHVKIVSTKKGVSEVQIMTPESVDDLYHGITPNLVPDFYGLKGDTSDNIPGVPGIGPKKAAALIVKYGNLDEVIAHADEVKGKMGENLRAHVDDALLSREIATIRTDAPIDIELSDAKFPTFDPTEVTKAFSALGFTGLTGRLARLGGDAPRVTVAGERNPAADAAAAAAPAAPATVLVPKPLEDDAATAALEDAARAGTWLGCAVEEDPSAGTLFSQGYTLWVSVADDVLLRFAGDAANAALRLAFAEGHVAAGDVKALFHRLSPVDSSLPETMAAGSVVPDRIFDVGVAAYLLESDRSSFEVRGLAEQFLSSALPEEDAAPAAAVEAVASRLLVPVLAQRLANDGSADVMNKIEMPLLPVLAQMERVGLSVDPAILARQSAELGAEFFHTLVCIRQFHCDQGDVIAEGRRGLGLMPERNVQIWPCYKTQFRQFQMKLASLHIHDLPFKFLHGILGRNPGASGTAPAGGAGDSHLHAQRIRKPHCISVGLLPAVGKIRPLERRRLRHVDAAGIELVESGYAHGIHPFKVFLYAFRRHFSIHPVPPYVRPRSALGLLETGNQRINRH